jgi:transcriptional regulator with XRE-family HTH domain
MTTETPPADLFARRIRDILEAKHLTIAELAERAELAASLVSKLLTETDAARREPRLEHVLAIARALEAAPRDLVLGTPAESLLGEWLPRDEFEAESKARSLSQTEAAQLRTELAGARSEAGALRSTVDQLSQEVATATRRIADVEVATRREVARLRVACESTEAKLAAALVERDRALAVAQQNYQAWANARSQMLQLQREVADAKGSASAGWMAALIGTVGGAILGAAAAEPTVPVASKPRRRSPRRT